MRVEHHNHLRDPVSAEATRVLVFDDFAEGCMQHGIYHTAIVKKLKPR